MINLKVLYVEDSLMARKVVGEFLEENVVVLDVANDGEDALAKFSTGEYDLIITDLKMPNMDGYTFMKEVRKVNKEIDIIVVSAFKGDKELSECQEVNIYDFLEKPLDLNLLDDSLKRVAVKLGRML